LKKNNVIAGKWLALAKKDQNMARIAAKHSEDLYAAFHLQQCIEKCLKGIIIFFTDEQPPYIHDLVRLGHLCQAHFYKVKDYTNVFTALSSYYITSRYPEYKETVSKALTTELLDSFFKTSEEIISWFEQEMKP
jgi:HEPN domain-containing protein